MKSGDLNLRNLGFDTSIMNCDALARRGTWVLRGFFSGLGKQNPKLILLRRINFEVAAQTSVIAHFYSGFKKVKVRDRIGG